MRAFEPSALPDDKRVYVEFLGGDLDGLTIDSDSTDNSEQQLIEMAYTLTNGGQVGKSFHGYSVGAIQHLIRHGPEGMFRKNPVTGSHQYTVAERLEERDEILLRMKYAVRPRKAKAKS